VVDALALAWALGHRPRGRFIGVEARPTRPRLTEALSPELMAAIGPAVRRVQVWVERLRATDGEDVRGT
jgi:hypothetical protein